MKIRFIINYNVTNFSPRRGDQQDVLRSESVGSQSGGRELVAALARVILPGDEFVAGEFGERVEHDEK